MRDIVEGQWQSPAGDADGVVGEGMWALPGLVDAHAHLASDQMYASPGDFAGAQRRAREALQAGVTLVWDKGWADATAIEAIDSVPAEDRPDVEAAATVISVAEGYYPNFAAEIDPSHIEEAVDLQAKAGIGWVKLIGDWPRRGVGPVGNFTLDELRRAVETADALSCRVAIHTLAREVPSMAVAAGVHSIEHGIFLTEEDIDALGQRRGMWVPTVLRVEALIAQLGEESSGGRLLAAGLANVRRLLPLAAEAGVHVLAGTDLVGSPSNVANEALRLADLGLGGRGALQAVGMAGFEATERPRGFEVGTPANAVLFAENPFERLEVLAHPAVVVRHGSVR